MKSKDIIISSIFLTTFVIFAGVFFFYTKNTKLSNTTTTTTTTKVAEVKGEEETTTTTTIPTTTVAIVADEKITIKFNTNGGNTLKPLTIEKGGKVVLPIPTKKGYVFVEWRDKNNKKITNNSVFKTNLTLKAVWKVQETTTTTTEEITTESQTTQESTTKKTTKSTTTTTTTTTTTKPRYIYDYYPLASGYSCENGKIKTVYYNINYESKNTSIYEYKGNKVIDFKDVDHSTPDGEAINPFKLKTIYGFADNSQGYAMLLTTDLRDLSITSNCSLAKRKPNPEYNS